MITKQQKEKAIDIVFNIIEDDAIDEIGHLIDLDEYFDMSTRHKKAFIADNYSDEELLLYLDE